MPSSVRFSTVRMFSLLLLLFFHLRACHSSPSIHPLCHDEESHALLQFKQSLAINESTSSDPSAYPKVASWKVDGESRDCCSWDGVECDMDSGHVISLDLSSICLYGSIDSNSTLFHLVHLGRLNLADNDFNNSEIPSEIRNLPRLFDLNLSMSVFSGQIPAEILELSKLVSIDLGSNYFSGAIPSSLGNLTKLNYLDLYYNSFSGKIPSTFVNLLQLTYLSLSSNTFSSVGQIPSWIGNHTLLISLKLGSNRLHGPIPESILRLPNLEKLDLQENLFRGTVNVGLLKSKSLVSFQLNAYNLSVIGNINDSVALPKFQILGLGGCNLSGEFPSFLHGQNHWSFRLVKQIEGKYQNGFEQSVDILPWNNLRVLKLSGNKLEGALPIPPRSIINYMVSDNRKIPRSLANCTKLEILNIGKNKINDVFPSWLGIFPKLRVLILRSNRLHGVIGKPRANFEFQRLQIVDLSGNCFRGKLPLEYFRNWTAMKTIYKERPLYMQVVSSFRLTGYVMTVHFDYSMTMTNKGVLTSYEKIQEFLTAIDLSSNRFEGGIPDALGDLKELYLLNLSNNLLTGRIPPSLSNLKELEALDLSQNKLSGEIPVQLAQLTFLAVFNVSHNVLSGPIPRGNQFDTFDRTSFDANPGLCGKPLSRKCGNGEDSLPAAKRDEGSAAYPLEFGWKVVVIGYASGLVIGVILGCVMDTRKYEWLYVMIVLKGSVPISFGGTEQPAAYGELVSIGGLSGDVNKKLSSAIATILESKLSVPKSRPIKAKNMHSVCMLYTRKRTRAWSKQSTQKMPCLNISTNVNLDGVNTSSILSEASSQVAKILKKPESYVMIVLKGSVPISFGGTEEPAAYGELVSIGGLSNDVNKKLSSAISTILLSKLSVLKSRLPI
uniref:Leucine-rich repeat-containing N-terminal plant-type domain-containing protein n=1 Tax=Salix viminalis TaxID=40686 RepID=A0A6N2K8W1_SALVM